jgi:transcriptional regulator with AAA-type ATPase domain
VSRPTGRLARGRLARLTERASVARHALRLGDQSASQRRAKFERASGRTLFLDEVGDT